MLHITNIGFYNTNIELDITIKVTKTIESIKIFLNIK
jgi:hypothetical protein